LVHCGKDTSNHDDTTKSKTIWTTPLTTKTMSISISMKDLTTEHQFLYLPGCEILLYKRDVMCKLSLSLVFCPEGHKLLTKSQTITLEPKNHIKILYLEGEENITSKQTRHRTHENHSEKYLNQVLNHIWMTHPNDAGQAKHVVCVELTTDRPIFQYPLKLEHMAGIQEAIDGLLMAGVIHETHSEYNMPLFPVKKSDPVNWHIVQDFRPINEVTAGESHHAFFTINIAPESQKCFAFTFNGKQYTYAQMPQEWKHSPGYFNHFLRKDLTDLTLNSKCTLIQYVDDILIVGPTSQDVLQATVKLLTHLSTKGYKVKRKKVQVARRTVHFLGRVISNGAQGITDKAPGEQIVREGREA
uniref:Reverse transcriptase domain-containing protein n=1 Tax=Periophthalmus magnuspinnatus TaxID=409849 RepID=A0A3B4AEZ1_9GOBI